MKTIENLLLLLSVVIMLSLSNCSRNDENDLFKILTTPVWHTDSLLSNGVDASQPGQLLAKFKGDAKFRDDGTGTFGIYKGSWWFTENRTQIIIRTDSLPLPLTCKIIELTGSSFKITTAVPDPLDISRTNYIRMTFKPK